MIMEVTVNISESYCVLGHNPLTPRVYTTFFFFEINPQPLGRGEWKEPSIPDDDWYCLKNI